MLSAGDALLGVSVHLRREVRGPIIASEAVLARDVAEAMSEVCFEAGLRRDGSVVELSELTAQLRPVYRPGGQAGRICDGFTLTAEWRPGETTSCSFERSVLEPVARRASRRLIEKGVLDDAAVFYYEIDASEIVLGPLSIEGEVGARPADAGAIAPLLGRARAIPADAEQVD